MRWRTESCPQKLTSVVLDLPSVLNTNRRFTATEWISVSPSTPTASSPRLQPSSESAYAAQVRHILRRRGDKMRLAPGRRTGSFPRFRIRSPYRTRCARNIFTGCFPARSRINSCARNTQAQLKSPQKSLKPDHSARPSSTVAQHSAASTHPDSRLGT